jgi:hypothetical protein
MRTFGGWRVIAGMAIISDKPEVDGLREAVVRRRSDG